MKEERVAGMPVWKRRILAPHLKGRKGREDGYMPEALAQLCVFGEALV